MKNSEVDGNNLKIARERGKKNKLKSVLPPYTFVVEEMKRILMSHLNTPFRKGKTKSSHTIVTVRQVIEF